MSVGAHLVVWTAQLAAFVAAYWWLFLILFLVWVVALNGLRSEHRVFKDLTVSAKLLPTLRAVLGSDLTIYVIALGLGIVIAFGFVNSLDRWLQDHIAADAVAVGERIQRRAQYRLHARCEDLLKRLYLRGDKRGAALLPDWARHTPGQTTGIVFDDTTNAPTDSQLQDGDLLWRALKVAKDPAKRREALPLLGRLARKPGATPLPEKDAQALKQQVKDKFGLVDAEFDRQVNVLKNLLLAGPPSGFADADLDDFDLFFQITPDGKKFRLQPHVAGFLKDQTGGFLGAPLARVYAPPFASFSIPGAAARQAAVDNLFQRVGNAYEDPTTKEVSDQIKIEARTLKRKLNQDDRFVYLVLVLGLTPATDEKEPGPVDSAEYDLGGQDLDKAISSKLAGKIERGIIHTIEYNTSGKRPFTLKVTWIRLRSMIRGPIQLVTLIIFFTGMILLVVKGYILGVWTQLSYLPFRLQPFTPLEDPYDIRWHEIWRDQREIGNADPVARQVVAAGEQGNDLLPFMLCRVFQSLESGGGLENALATLEQSSTDWLEERDREYVILDYLEYLLPALGFIGTLIGNGQGLSIANQVVLPDPETQAESISTMTSHLGMAFYATLVALCCAIPYLFCRSLLTRLQLLVVQVYKAKLKRYLLSHVVIRPSSAPAAGPWSDAAGQSATPSVEYGQSFVEIVSLLIHRMYPADLQGVFPSDILGTPISDRASLLARVLIVTGAIKPNNWDYYARNVLAYSMFPPLIDDLPEYWMHLGHVLYCMEVRPMQTFLTWYGLPSGFDPTRTPPHQPQARRHTPEDFFDFIHELLAGFGREYLKGKERKVWKALCAGRWERLTILQQLLSDLVRKGEGYDKEAAFLRVVEGCRPPIRLLMILADGVASRRPGKRKRALALLANPPRQLKQSWSLW